MYSGVGPTVGFNHAVDKVQDPTRRPQKRTFETEMNFQVI